MGTRCPYISTSAAFRSEAADGTTAHAVQREAEESLLAARCHSANSTEFSTGASRPEMCANRTAGKRALFLLDDSRNDKESDELKTGCRQRVTALRLLRLEAPFRSLVSHSALGARAGRWTEKSSERSPGTRFQPARTPNRADGRMDSWNEETKEVSRKKGLKERASEWESERSNDTARKGD
eukprot:3023507-Pleurochrysis_carterae.AAC.2